MTHIIRPSRSAAAVGVLVLCAAIAVPALNSAGRKFYSDDPIARELDTEDASGVQPWEINLAWDLSLNAFATPARTATIPRAGNINTIDEVPDSNWFTNRLLVSQPLTADAIARGPLTGDGPAPGPLTIVRAKEAGASPGFRLRDSRGVIWFVSFDARGYPEAATGAILVANKLFWAMGYWQVENYLLTIRPEQLAIGDGARITPPSGRPRTMRQSDVDDVLERSHRSADGSYRAIAGKAVPGTPLGGFRFHGTRPDDPNDIVPHEDRRELRALKVFGAWTNLVDMKAGNTLDTLIEENGRRVVRHYLQDVGSTFGAGAFGPHDYDEGWEPLFAGDALMKRLLTFGAYTRPWQTVAYKDVPAIGRFEGDVFDPVEWQPRVPTAALLRARPDDTFWAARRVAAFTDDMIRAAARTGAYSDPASAEHLASVLIQRRDKIAQAYLTAVTPVVDVALDASGLLTFVNAAERAGVAPASKGYSAQWARFDNATGVADPIGPEVTAVEPALQSPAALPREPGSYVRVQVRAVGAVHMSWSTPVDVYFRRTSDGWTLVGLERLQ
jgi:hypothetical protein